jgi:hypothetical protein
MDGVTGAGCCGWKTIGEAWFADIFIVDVGW